MHNFGWLVVEKLVRLVLGVGVGFWVARYLGPVGFGSLGYCAALVALVGILPELGLDPVLKRDLLQAPAKTAELLVSAFVLRLSAGVLAYGLVLVVVLGRWGLSEEESRLLAILGLLLFQPAWFTIDLWLQVHLRAKLSIGMLLIALVICSAWRIQLILRGASVAAFAWVITAEMFLGALGITIAAYRAGLRLPTLRPQLALMRRLVRESWPLLFAGVAVVVYMKIDVVMLKQMMGPEAAGIYTAATRLSEVWYFFPVALGSSVLPAILRARGRDPGTYRLRLQQYYDLSAGVAYALSIPIALAAPWLVKLAYGAAFAPAGPILAVHIWSSIFVFLGVARGQWLVNESLQTFYLFTVLAGAVLNVGLNLLLIPRWGGLGAAYATVAAYALAAWLASYCHPAVRETAGMQSRALLIPFRAWRYLRDS
ncbi:MAG: polysaccharide biosynthesis protein [Verrucomicrobia bacterium]|nr:polysaccharide biosynthesis protein [Verrucomicrobiota bacterium]